jgi:hypothetical protein
MEASRFNSDVKTRLHDGTGFGGTRGGRFSKTKPADESPSRLVLELALVCSEFPRLAEFRAEYHPRTRRGQAREKRGEKKCERVVARLECS